MFSKLQFYFSLEELLFIYITVIIIKLEYYPVIREFIQQNFKKTQKRYYQMLLVLLHFCRHKKKIKGTNIIINDLLRRSINNNEFAMILFWELNFLKQGKYKLIYCSIQDKLVSVISKHLKKKIKQQQNFIEYLRINFKKKLSPEIIEKMHKYFTSKEMYKNSVPVITNPYFNLLKLI